MSQLKINYIAFLHNMRGSRFPLPYFKEWWSYLYISKFVDDTQNMKFKIGITDYISNRDRDLNKDIYVYDDDDEEEQKVFDIGDKVSAKTNEWRVYYPGTVTSRNADGSYNIQFDDGETRTKVKKVKPASYYQKASIIIYAWQIPIANFIEKKLKKMFKNFIQQPEEKSGKTEIIKDVEFDPLVAIMRMVTLYIAMEMEYLTLDPIIQQTKLTILRKYFDGVTFNKIEFNGQIYTPKKQLPPGEEIPIDMRLQLRWPAYDDADGNNPEWRDRLYWVKIKSKLNQRPSTTTQEEFDAEKTTWAQKQKIATFLGSRKKQDLINEIVRWREQTKLRDGKPLLSDEELEKERERLESVKVKPLQNLWWVERKQLPGFNPFRADFYYVTWDEEPWRGQFPEPEPIAASWLIKRVEDPILRRVDFERILDVNKLYDDMEINI